MNTLDKFDIAILNELQADARLTNAELAQRVGITLANISISDLIDLILPLVVVFAVSVLSIFVMMKVLPVWKILGDKSMAFGVGFCQMLGFPSTYLISVEVCNAVAEDEDEKAFLMSRVMPRLVVGGMAAMASTPSLAAWAASSWLSFVLLQATWAITVRRPAPSSITASRVFFLSSTDW